MDCRKSYVHSLFSLSKQKEQNKNHKIEHA